MVMTQDEFLTTLDSWFTEAEPTTVNGLAHAAISKWVRENMEADPWPPNTYVVLSSRDRGLQLIEGFVNQAPHCTGEEVEAGAGYLYRRYVAEKWMVPQ